MKPLNVVLLSLTCVLGGCSPTADVVRSSAVSPSLTDGTIAVIKSANDKGMPDQLALVSIPWDASFGMSAIRIKIPGTPYAIPLVGGKVAPVLIKEHPLQVWRINGMRFDQSGCESITFANRIEPSNGQLKLILTGGEIYEIWTLDFIDTNEGLRVSYYNGSG